MIKIFSPIKSRRPWPPISISHLFQQGSFRSWPLLFLHLGCFCLDLYILQAWVELGLQCLHNTAALANYSPTRYEPVNVVAITCVIQLNLN